LLDQISFARKKFARTSHSRNQHSLTPSSQSVMISTPPSGNSLLRFAPDIDLRQYPIDATLASTMFPKSIAMSPKLTARKTFGKPKLASFFPIPPGLAGRVEQCKTTTPTCQRSESRFLQRISILFFAVEDDYEARLTIHVSAYGLRGWADVLACAPVDDGCGFRFLSVVALWVQ
jgi:hypothetical protein